MTYTVSDWVEDVYHCVAWPDQPQARDARIRLEKRFAHVRPAVEEPKWTIDRLLIAYLWIMRHASELDTPAAIVGKEQFAISRYLAEALYRICMRMQDSDLYRDIDLAFVMKATREQEALDK